MTLHYLPSQRHARPSPNRVWQITGTSSRYTEDNGDHWSPWRAHDDPNASYLSRARRQERRERLRFIAYSLALAATAFLLGWLASQ